ncbi:MAG: universal stress protein [Gammaproteobacteria bacterium]
MSVYQHVLAVIDFSEASTGVLQHAAPLAELCNARLTVLHVVNYSPTPEFEYMLPREDDSEIKLIEAAEKRLQELLEREALSSGVEGKVVVGRPKVEIVRIAKRNKVDLIVIGAHGHHGIGGLLGSTTDRVLHHAACDVLTVR